MGLNGISEMISTSSNISTIWLGSSLNWYLPLQPFPQFPSCSWVIAGVISTIYTVSTIISLGVSQKLYLPFSLFPLFHHWYGGQLWIVFPLFHHFHNMVGGICEEIYTLSKLQPWGQGLSLKWFLAFPPWEWGPSMKRFPPLPPFPPWGWGHLWIDFHHFHLEGHL